MKEVIKVNLRDFLAGAKIFVPIVVCSAASLAVLCLFFWGASFFPLTAVTVVVTIVVVNICISLGANERRGNWFIGPS
jgi:hypothetical protein